MTSKELPFRRWLFITQYYHPEVGAPQIRLRALAEELTRRGCQVHVLAAMPNYPLGRIYADYRGKIATTEVIDGCVVQRLWLYARAGRSSAARLLCYFSFTLMATLYAPFIRRSDVVFVEAQPISLALAGLICKLFRRIPFIYNTPDLQVEIAGEARWIGSRTLLAMAQRIESFLMRHSFCVSTVTTSFANHFATARTIPKERISLLPNGADTNRLRPGKPDREFARKLGVDGKAVFTYCGTQAHYHGLEFILDAAQVLQDRKDVVILMVGNGPVRPELERRVRFQGLSNVLFAEVPFSEVARLMSFTRAALATVANMPVATKMRLSKVVPPLACGVPVIYAGDGEFTEILTEHRCGLTVTRSSPLNLSTAIAKLADDPDLALNMGMRGREYVEQNLSWTDIVDRWLDDLRCIKSGKDLWQYRAQNAQRRETPVRSLAEG